MLTHRRLVLAGLVLVLVGGAWTALQLWRVQDDLAEARSHADELRSAIDLRDARAVNEAAARLRVSTKAAADRTDGTWWSAMVHLPVLGDDAAGIRAATRSLHVIAEDGVVPLAGALVRFDDLTVDGRVDVEMLERLDPSVGRARVAFSRGAELVSGVDSSGYLGALRSDFDDYVDFVVETDRALASADTALDVVPAMVGADGPRDYLMVFQNNAEIRSTGGVPGSWALVHADRGRLTMVEQGSAADFGERMGPVLPLGRAERALFGPQLGTYFQDATFTPDFPRAARLLAARWEESAGGPRLDGVISVDTVALSYLLEGTGDVRVPTRGVTLTPANAVDVLLSDFYAALGPEEQDAAFDEAAKAVFDAATGDLPSSRKFVAALGRAADERRLLVASFDRAAARALAGSRVAGELTGDDGDTPHVDIALNDATGSKMSYYLRSTAAVRPTECAGDVQSLLGTMTLDQTVSAQEAAGLPAYVTGGGRYGTEPGSQLLLVRLLGPSGGRFLRVEVDGASVEEQLRIVRLAGRPVATVAVQLSGRPIDVEWLLQTGPGQTGDIEVRMTPGIVPGPGDSVVPSGC